jgi:hypothetical protein
MKHTATKSIYVMVFVSALGRSLCAAEDNSIYNELINQGIPLANGKILTLPEPVMADGLKSDAQQAVLKQVGPKIKELMQQFQRGRPNDWYEDKQSSEKGAKPEDSIGRRIDLYFVAQGKLETVASDGFVKKQIKQEKEGDKAGETDAAKKNDAAKDADQEPDAKQPEKKKQAENGKVEFYTPAELKTRKLAEQDTNNLKERFAHGVLNLLDKVQVIGNGDAIETRTPESLIIAFKIDRRFDKDAKYPNQYQLIKAVGPPLALGDAKLYTGFGAYAKITKLQGSDNKIFVEYHLVYDEPYEWFKGTTELISKLDTSYKENISKFRRNILDYEKASLPTNPK